MMRLAFLTLIFWFVTASAGAEVDGEALRLFSEGAYEVAAETASAVGGAENLALAARALNAGGYLTVDDKDSRKTFKRAYEYAEAAIAVDPKLVEGHLQAAISLAQRGSRMATWRAFMLGMAKRARDEIDAALLLDPDGAWTLSMSAGWHLEVARKGGSGIFGSDPQLGRIQFVAAQTTDPNNIAIAYECALRLLAASNPDWREDALFALDVASRGEPRDAFERALQSRAKGLEAAIAKGPKAERAFIDEWS